MILQWIVLTAAGALVDSEEARAAVALVRAAQNSRPQPDPLAPGQRVQPDVARNHRHVEVVPPLGPDVHVAPEYLQQLHWAGIGGRRQLLHRADQTIQPFIGTSAVKLEKSKLKSGLNNVIFNHPLIRKDEWF